MTYSLRRSKVAVRLAAEALKVRALAVVGDPLGLLLTSNTRPDATEIHERIRRRGELARSITGHHVVTSHALCQQVFRNPRIGMRYADGTPPKSPADDIVDLPFTASLVNLDDPEHARLRKLAAPAFRPALIRGFADRIEATAHRLLDRADTVGHFDVIADFAAPLPITVISELLGVGEQDTTEFAEIGAIVGQALDGVQSLAQADRLRRAQDDLVALFERLIAERRASPRDDVISALTAACDDGRMTEQDLLETCGLLLIAGFETTVNLIGNGVATMIGTDMWRRLADEPAAAPAAVEETLRFEPPVQFTFRTTHTAMELGGYPVRAGTTLYLDLVAANRDPAVFEDPLRFDIDRNRSVEHLAFSSGGHYCMGAGLARLEGAIALRALAQRFPDLRPLPGASRRRGNIIRGYANFPASTK